MDPKEFEKLKTKIRSQIYGNHTIKVIYLGRLSGNHFGKVIEVEARHASRTSFPFPYPKHTWCDYRIDDEAGDVKTISEDGITFDKGWFPVPDDFELGDVNG